MKKLIILSALFILLGVGCSESQIKQEIKKKGRQSNESK